MDDTIAISVITVSYNSADFIRETIESVLSQDYQNFEYIICDDNSTDDTWRIVQHFDDGRIRAYRNERNLGEYENRNKAMSLAKGEYLIFIDGDDVMYPHALNIFTKYAMAFPECALLIAKDWDHRIKCPYKVEPAEFYRFEFFGTSLMGNFTKLLFKTSILQRERFPSYVRSGDSYMQLKIAQTNAVLIMPDGLTWWRRRTGNATSTLLRDHKFYAEYTNYLLELLNSQCPLNNQEIEMAKINVYGIFLRLIFWLLIRCKFNVALYLVRNVKIPPKYLRAFLVPRKKSFLNNVTGDVPLHTPMPANS